jgi:hypothetical protein
MPDKQAQRNLISEILLFYNESSENDFSLQVLKLLVSVYTFSPLQIEFIKPNSPGTYISISSISYISFAGETFSPPPDSLI